MKHLSLLATTLLAFTTLSPVAMASTPEKETSTYELLNLFGDVFDRVRSDYVEEVTDEKLIESALNGMLTSLDPHSSYMNEKQFEEMQVQTKGEFGGLGIEVTMDSGLVKVVSPIDETPAAKAGLKPNDFISQIDETPVMGLSLSEAVEKMRGPVDTKVELTVLREGEKEPFKVTLTRAVIKIQAVRSRAEEDVAYIRINSFTETTYDMMKSEIEKQEKAIGKKLKGVVLDLRNNPGGLLDQAIAVSDAFLERGEIVSTRSRKPEESKRYSATEGDLTHGLPLVVIINEGSASASEIVAGALRDHKRAIVLGMKSFGKGSVQTVIPIKDHGAIRLTTARYYTPSGTSIQAEGIVPDIEVQQAKVEIEKKQEMLSEANLPRHLINKEQEKFEKRKEKETGKKLGELSAKDDYQLSRALDLIRAVSIYGALKSQSNTTTAATEPHTLRVQ
ncbi:MAG: S41 family peptidase [Rickettsiales bacterium]